MGDDVEAILLVFAIMVAFVAIIVVLDLKQRGALEGGSSGNLLPPSPPAEKAATRQDQAWKSSTGDGTGNCYRLHLDAYFKIVHGDQELKHSHHEHGLQDSIVNCCFLDNRTSRGVRFQKKPVFTVGSLGQ